MPASNFYEKILFASKARLQEKFFNVTPKDWRLESTDDIKITANFVCCPASLTNFYVTLYLPHKN